MSYPLYYCDHCGGEFERVRTVCIACYVQLRGAYGTLWQMRELWKTIEAFKIVGDA